MKVLDSRTSILALLVLLACATAGRGQGSLIPPGPPGPTMKTLAQIEPRTPIGSLPFAIKNPGSYYLTTNVTGIAGSHGITVEVSDVSLDLNGFTLGGVPGASSGIHVIGGQGNVAIRNGTIHSWATAIDARGGSECRFESLRISENALHGLAAGTASIVESCLSYSNQGIGISANSGSTIKDSSARGNLLHGIVADVSSRVVACNASHNFGSGIVASNSCVISGSIAYSNSASGIATGEDVQISGSKASGNGGSGFFAGGNATLNLCSASGNLGAGLMTGMNGQVIECKAVANTKGIVVLAGSTVRGCTAIQNSGDGILFTSECTVSGNSSNSNFLARDAAGIHALGTDNVIKENTVLSNDMGILVDLAGNMIIKNTAANNSLNYRINGTPQSMGPIVSSPLPDVTNPIANFEF